MTRGETRSYKTSGRFASLPFWPSMAGGLLVLIEGLVMIFQGPVLASSGAEPMLGAMAFGLVVTLLGAVIAWGAYSIRSNPARRATYGAIVVMLSVVALVLAGGGFIVGSILGILGGSWAIMTR